jgi:hypothetical protein
MDSAVEEAQKMATLVPWNSENFLKLGITLQANRDCRAIEAFENYLHVCRMENECEKAQQQHIELLINSAKIACN